jgi:hypothetical protein
VESRSGLVAVRLGSVCSSSNNTSKWVGPKTKQTCGSKKRGGCRGGEPRKLLLVSCDYIYMSISKVCGMSVSGDELGIPTRIGAPF